MLTLVQNVLRVAHEENNSLPKDHKVIAKKLKALTANTDEIDNLAEYLEELHEVDSARAAEWLKVIKSEYPITWDQLVGASEAIDGEEITRLVNSEANTDDLDNLDLSAESSQANNNTANEASVDTEQQQEQAKAPINPPEAQQATEPVAVDTVVPENITNAVEPVVTQEELQNNNNGADFFLSLFNEDAENPHYAVFMNGRPLAQFSLMDQDRPEEIKDAFISAEFAEHVAQTLDQFSPAEVLESLKAKYYYSVINHGKVAERAASVAEEQLEDQYISRLAALKEEFLNTVQLAFRASNKGSNGQFIKNNMKAALRQALREAGVVNPMGLVDEVWANHAGEYFNAILNKAEEWMGYSPEALHEVTKEIIGSNAQEDTEESLAEEDGVTQAEFNAANNGIFNIPIRTSGALPRQEDDKEDLRSYYKRIVGKALRSRHTLYSGTPRR